MSTVTLFFSLTWHPYRALKLEIVQRMSSQFLPENRIYSTNCQAIEMNAIHLNNMGVIAFEDGKVEAAINFFGRSLSLTKLSITIGTKKPDGSNQGREREPLELRASPTPSRHSKVREDSLSDDDAKEFSRCNFLYLSPMRISAEEDVGEDDHKEQQLLVHCSSICIFNLALANHAQAIRTPDKGAAFCLFEKASRLYELSYTLWLQKGDSKNEIFIVLAILNNLGMIHKHCQRTVQGHQCMELLLSVLIFLKDSESVQYVSCVSNGSLDGFFSNIIRELDVLKRGISAPAA
jgi:hypothetical protein